MEKQIKLHNTLIKYTLQVSSRAKRLRLAIYANGELVVTKPSYLPVSSAEHFIRLKAEWILKKINHFKDKEISPLAHLTRRDYLLNREAARQLILERLAYLNQFYQFKFKGVSVRNQKTRWGSCSRQGGLNFNWRLFYLSPLVRDYVIVHELCHLKEFNHSTRFWKLVALTVPEYKKLRRELKNGPVVV